MIIFNSSDGVEYNQCDHTERKTIYVLLSGEYIYALIYTEEDLKKNLDILFAQDLKNCYIEFDQQNELNISEAVNSLISIVKNFYPNKEEFYNVIIENLKPYISEVTYNGKLYYIECVK